MAWFNFLKSEGFFDPDKNPEPIQVKDGFQIPYWEVLGYLEKLSIQISQGKEPELIEELLTVIKNVSEQPIDNYRTWYFFIKMLSNIPNEKIPKEILHFIPVWLSGKFDTMLQTSELCDKLLPKFLNDEPTQADIEKAQIILHYLFQVDKSDMQEDVWDGEGVGYRSKLYLHFLADKFEKRNITRKIVMFCSTDLILELGRTIKFILLDYPKGLYSLFKDLNKEYQIKIHIDKENLIVTSKLIDSKVAAATSTLSNWEEKSELELKLELVSILKEQNINYKPSDDNEDTFKRLYFALSSDLTSAYGFNSIRKLNDRYSRRDNVLDVFSLIFRDLLDEKIKQNQVEGLKLLNTICFDRKFFIPFYKRISLYIICENWEKTKSLFFELIKDNDALHLFSIFMFQKELFDLLSRNQNEYTDNELTIIEKIIDQGKQDGIGGQKETNNEYWKLGWYSALKDTKQFRERYLSLSKTLSITSEHYESLGETKVRWGSISPISTGDLLEKDNQEIADYITMYNPQRNFDEPSISGLSETFGNAVESNPEKFASEIELYQDIPYVYTYHMLNAFSSAWKEQKTFDWGKVLHYCLTTLKSTKFYNSELQIENDDLHAKFDWVVGSIANLLSGGLQNDKQIFDFNLLPIVKEIILIIVSNLKPVEEFKETNIDYPTYSYNSTAGKSLRSLFDYSLYRARILFKFKDKGKWEGDIKALFEETIQKGIIDGFILEGMYFEQFCFLDYDWITDQVKRYYKREDRQWLAFMGGFAFARPPYNKKLYSIFYPHYERLIENNIKLQGFSGNGLVSHLTSFYFWKYETLSSGKLLFKFVNNATPSEVGELINFIWQQENYPQKLSEFEKNEFQQILFDLWKYLTDKYENSVIEEEQKNLASLSNWIVFAPELNDSYTNLILKSCKHIDKIHSTSELLENLVSLKTKGNPKTTAKAIGTILLALKFNDYIDDFDKDFIKDLVLFLFAHGQEKIASEFCNKIAAVYQQFFLREIYEANSK